MSADEPDTLAAARAEVERTREELGETVEALAYKADVKARAKDKAGEVKAKAAETVEQVKAKAGETVDEVKAKAEEVRAEADDVVVQAKGNAESAGDRVRRLPPAVLAAVALGLVALVVVLRRRS